MFIHFLRILFFVLIRFSFNQPLCPTGSHGPRLVFYLRVFLRKDRHSPVFRQLTRLLLGSGCPLPSNQCWFFNRVCSLLCLSFCFQRSRSRLDSHPVHGLRLRSRNCWLTGSN